MIKAEQREMDNLFTLRQSKYVKKLILENHCKSSWERTAEGWEALSSELTQYLEADTTCCSGSATCQRECDHCT